MNRYIKRYFFVSILIFTQIIFGASLDLRVNSTTIPKGHSLVVKLIAEGSDVKFPSISKIDGYEVEDLQKTNKMLSIFVNGKVSTKNQKILKFVLYPQKSITIPSFEVLIDGKKFTTKPLKIKVVNASVASGGGSSFSVVMKSDKKELFLGEPLILSVDVIEPMNGEASQIQYIPPKFDGFFVKSLGGENLIKKSTETIHELKYLLIPEKIGHLSIQPAQIKVGIADRNAVADPFGMFGIPMRWQSIRANSLDIFVKPVPKDVDLVGNFTISAKVDKREVEANKPVNYTLIIKGEGNLEDLEDPKFDIPGVTVYGDEAKVNTTYRNGRLYSEYIKKYAFISDKSFKIPAVSLNVFDYKRDKIYTISTKPIDIKIKGSSAISPSKTLSTQASNTISPKSASQDMKAKIESKKQTKKEDWLNDEEYYEKMAYEQKSKQMIWYIAGAFFAGMLTMFILIRVFSNRKRSFFKNKSFKHYSFEEALKILYPHINESSEIENTVRKLYEIKEGNTVEIDRKALDKLVAKYDKNI